MSGVLSKLRMFSVIANVHTDAPTRWRRPIEILAGRTRHLPIEYIVVTPSDRVTNDFGFRLA